MQGHPTDSEMREVERRPPTGQDAKDLRQKDIDRMVAEVLAVTIPNA